MSTIIIIITLIVGYMLARAVFLDLYAIIRQIQADATRLAAMRAKAVRHIVPQTNGQIGTVICTVRGQTVIRNLDDGTVYTPLHVVHADEATWRLNRLERLAIASGKRQGKKAIMTSTVPRLPSRTIGEIINAYNLRPSLSHIVIGETVDPLTGEQAPVELDIPRAVHVICAGSSGMGKSTLLEAIAIQLAGVDDVHLAAVDFSSGTFDGLSNYLAYPLADSPDRAVNLLAEIRYLINRRCEMWKRYERIRSLAQYNIVSGENVPFVLLLIDETPAVMSSRARDALVDVMRIGRKYGVGFILGGTDFKVDTVPSEARNNCQARIAFWMEDGLSRSLIGTSCASTLAGRGDAWLKRPGQTGVIRVQTPLVSDADYTAILGKKQITDHPVIEGTTISTEDKIRRTADELRATGRFSLRAVEQAVFGYCGGAAHETVKRTLAGK